MKKAKFKKLFLTAGIVIVILAAALLVTAPFVIRHVLLKKNTATRIEHEIETRVGESLNMPLKLDGVSIDIWGRFKVDGVRLGKKGNELLKGGDVSVSLDWRKLIKDTKRPEKAVGDIVFKNPRINLIRYPDGKWNYPTMKPGKKGPSFPEINIKLEKASLDFQDQFATPSLIFRTVSMKELSGSILLHKSGRILIGLSSEDNSLCGGLDTTIDFHGLDGWMISGECRKIKTDAASVFLSQYGIAISGAAPTLSFKTSAKYNGIGHIPDYSYSLVSDIDGADLYFKRYDMLFRNTHGRMDFTNGIMSFNNASADYAGGRINADGTLKFEKKISYAIRLETDGVRIENTGKWIKKSAGPAEGSITGTAFISGDSASPRAEFNANVSDFRNSQINVQHIEGSGSYYGRTLVIKHAVASFAGGDIDAKGTYLFGGKKMREAYSFDVRFAGIDASYVSSLLKKSGAPASSGTISGNALIAKESADLSPDAFGTIYGSDIHVQPLDKADYANASFFYNKDGLEIENLTLTGRDIYLIANGRIGKKGELDIDIEGAEINVSSALSLIGRKDISSTGKVRFSGTIAGPASSPDFTGQIDGTKISVSDLDVERLSGGLEFDNGILALENVSFSFGRARHIVAGLIDTEKEALSLRIKIDGAPIDKITAALHDFAGTPEPDINDLSGSVFASTNISGTFSAPVIDSSIRLENLHLYGEDIDLATMNIVYNQQLSIIGGRLMRGKSQAHFSGTVGNDDINVEFLARRFDAAGFNAAAKNDLGGSLDISGKISGPAKSPLMTATLSSPKLLLREVDFKLEPMAVRYENDVMNFDDITLHRAMETYSASGTYDLAGKSLDMKVAFTDATPHTGEIYTGKTLPQGTNGLLYGNIRIVTVGGKLTGTVTVQGSNIMFANYPVGTADISGTFTGNKFEISNFSAANETSEFTAAGTVDIADPKKSLLTLDAVRIDLGMLASANIIPYPLKGLADVNIAVSGTEDRSYLYGSLYAYNLSMADITFDQARGSFEFNDDLLTLTQLQFVKDKQRLLVRGDIPITAKQDAPDNRFQMILSSANFDLATLNPAVSKYGFELSGGAEVQNVLIRGAIDRPTFEGAIQISDGTLNHRDFGNPIEKINGRLEASGNALVLSSLNATTAGRELKMNGGIFFKGLKLDRYEFGLEDANDIYVDYKKMYRGLVDIQGLKISGDIKGLNVTSSTGGQAAVTFHDGAFTIPSVAPAEERKAPTYSYAALDRDIVINAGKNLTAKTGGNKLNISPQGTIRIHGNLMQPEIKGYLTATRGYVWLSTLNLWFKLQDEAVIGFYRLEPFGVTPFFYASATAHKSGIDIDLEVSGPMVNLEQVPEYQKMCMADTTEAAAGGFAASAVAPTVMIGGHNVSTCPTVRLTGITRDGSTLTADALLRKLTLTASIEEGQTVSTIMRDQFASLFASAGSSYVEQYASIDNFDLSLDPNRDIFIQLEKCLIDKVCFKYERLFSRQEEEVSEILYRFRKKSFLLWGIDQDNQQHFEVEYRLTF